MANQKPSTAATNDVLVAIDDGHSETKVVTFEGGTTGAFQEWSFASRTTPGFEEVQADGSAPPNFYALLKGDDKEPSPTAQEQMTVINRGRLGWGGVDESRDPNYPTSPRNRVLVHHALHTIAASKPGARFEISTTLPYSDYHLAGNGKVNKELVEAKKLNLSLPVLAYDTETPELALKPCPYTVADQIVMSEGTAAFFDLVWNYDGKTISNNNDFLERFAYGSGRFVLVDIGGKTTDVVAGTASKSNPAPMLELSTSKSLDMGALGLAHELQDALIESHGVKRVSDPENVLLTRTLSRFGRPVDVSDLVAKVSASFIKRLRTKISYAVGEESELSAIIFVGGGTELMREHIKGIYHDDLMVIPAEPRFANARGMAKFLKVRHASKKG
ncbi:StbA family protein [Acetobacter malorum DSM 14337]|uniref:StbA family protein n=1 Tax=Acetobacter malorum DSM 14337 TaxID=1307910 RepID=A0ABQ0PP90_9PROT|nr:ParM/StbA family protein [Acetobacter malorum]GBQ77243.1 StbA family protein [Acetobacter malorum DSM 14337]